MTATRLNAVDSNLDADLQALEQGDIYDSVFPCYEAIAQGDVVGLSRYTPSSGVEYDNSANGDSSVALSTTEWRAQKFTMPSGGNILDASNISVYVATPTIAQSNVTVSIRSSLTGADLVSFAHDFVSASPIWFSAGAVAGVVVPGNTYYLVVRNTPGSGDSGAQVRYSSTDANPPTNGEAWTSSDAGANWTQQAGRNYIIQISAYTNWALGHMELFKASASALDNRFGVIGYAMEAGNAGDYIKVSPLYVQTLSGLTIGRDYWLSDTAGQISNVRGTIPLYLGTAVSATKLVRVRNELSSAPIYLAVSTNYKMQTSGFVTGDDQTYTFYERSDYDPLEVAYHSTVTWSPDGASFPVRAGDSFTTSSNVGAVLFPMLGLAS